MSLPMPTPLASAEPSCANSWVWRAERSSASLPSEIVLVVVMRASAPGLVEIGIRVLLNRSVRAVAATRSFWPLVFWPAAMRMSRWAVSAALPIETWLADVKRDSALPSGAPATP